MSYLNYTIKTLIKNRYYYHIVYSPDDGGYYGEVFNMKGETVYTSAICVNENDVFIDIKNKGIELI